MHKYGIGNIVLYQSQRPIDDICLPALGAANLSELNGDVAQLDRTGTHHAINATFVRVEMCGHVDVSATRHKTPCIGLGECMFMSDGLCITATKTTVPNPLKPTASVKQLAKSGIKMTVCQMNNTIGRSVKVSGPGKHNYSGSIPISCCCLVDAATPCNKLFSILDRALLNHVAYLRHTLQTAHPVDQPVVYHVFSSSSFLPLNLLADQHFNVKPILSQLHLDSSLTKQALSSPQGPFQPEPNLGVICNPHEILAPPPNLPIVRYTKQRYGYYHYGQQGMNDSGWGCAYRSLQTLHSWFYYAGTTDIEPPSHKQIQETLVQIGDKPKDFINSRQWIGSFEVQFVLNELLDVTCRSINVASGLELEERIPELIDHFESAGTPVMIGGGVLAHTIVGVAWDDATRKGAFAILDPHFTGQHQIGTIKGKGVYWKGVEFWDAKAYYNMCLPLN